MKEDWRGERVLLEKMKQARRSWEEGGVGILGCSKKKEMRDYVFIILLFYLFKMKWCVS